MISFKNITIELFEQEADYTWTAHVYTESKQFFFISFDPSYGRREETSWEDWGEETCYYYSVDPITDFKIIDENGDDVNLNNCKDIKDAIEYIEEAFLEHLYEHDPEGN